MATTSLFGDSQRPDEPEGNRGRSSLFRARTPDATPPSAPAPTVQPSDAAPPAAAPALRSALSPVRMLRLPPVIDELTGLPDRRSLAAAFEDAVAAAHHDQRVSLALVDLRDFKNVNQMFGRDDGDLVLANVATRLVDRIGERATMVRLGGDEFAVVATHAEASDVDELAVGIIEALRDPFEIRTYLVHVGVNIGVATAEPGADDVESVTRRADIALYRSKRQGPYRYEVYEHSLHAQVSPAVIVDWLRSALDGGQLHLVYQPIFAMGGEIVVAVEALLRWNHPVEGPLLPDVVLPALEDSGLIVEVGEWVLDEACGQARRWADATPHGLPPIVFVNVSPRQLLSPTFLPALEAAIERHDIDAGQLCLELGGMSSVPETSQAWMLLRECKALGVRLALDNFGANDSAYGLIRRLQLDYIKLDRHLTNARSATPHDDAITLSVVSLARSLGFTTIAQGVEDPASLERARSFGCDLAQGFYFGVAEVPDAIDRQIANGRSLRRPAFH